MDMKALANALETATGGIVIYRTGGSIFLYRHAQSKCSLP